MLTKIINVMPLMPSSNCLKAKSLFRQPCNLAENLTLPRYPTCLDLDSDQISDHLKAIQEINGIEGDEFSTNGFPNFSVEMETGTGKTYIYLRTALELFQHYGMRKFIVVVPSVAIREGVLKTLQITEAHFRELYDNLPYRYYVYDSTKLSQVRQFALSDSVEIMVMTLASFNKASNIIRQSTERLQGEKPINLIKGGASYSDIR